MTTVVVDTNILVSGVLRARLDSPPVRLLHYWRAERFSLVTSTYIINELRRTLASAYFLARVTEQERTSFLEDLEGVATSVALIRSVTGVASQAKDDPILATALNARADYLVTGDKALLELGTFEGTRIVSAAELVALLDGLT